MLYDGLGMFITTVMGFYKKALGKQMRIFIARCVANRGEKSDLLHGS